jgi:hypothetical protein
MTVGADIVAATATAAKVEIFIRIIDVLPRTKFVLGRVIADIGVVPLPVLLFRPSAAMQEIPACPSTFSVGAKPVYARDYLYPETGTQE